MWNWTSVKLINSGLATAVCTTRTARKSFSIPCLMLPTIWLVAVGNWKKPFRLSISPTAVQDPQSTIGLCPNWLLTTLRSPKACRQATCSRNHEMTFLNGSKGSKKAVARKPRRRPNNKNRPKRGGFYCTKCKSEVFLHVEFQAIGMRSHEIEEVLLAG